MSEKKGIEKYTLTPNGIKDIFNKLSSEKISQSENILININLQFSGQKTEISDIMYYTLCDCYNNFQYFIFKKPPFSLEIDKIINIKNISYTYDSNKQFFSLIINEYDINKKALFQIFPFTTLFNVNKYLNIFSYFKKKPIDYLKYNVLSNLDTLPKKLSFYVRVISKVTLTSFSRNKENKHDGNFFYFDVVDINNDTIRIIATYSNANYYYYKIKINSIYSISGNFFLHEITKYQEHNKANPLYKFYKNLKMPTKEIYLGNDSKVIEMDDSDDSNLISIDENRLIIFDNIFSILNMKNTDVDLVNTIGIVIKVGCCFKKTYPLREIEFLDESNNKIKINLWNQYTLYPIKIGDVLLIKNIQVKKDNNKNNKVNLMTTVDETNIIINPEIEKTNILKLFYKNYIENDTLNNSNKNNRNNKIIKGKNNYNILKYINNYKSNEKQFIFIQDIINLKNDINIKRIYGYIKKIIYNTIDDIIVCVCLSCLKLLTKKNSFWYCPNCKKTLIFPSYIFKDIILNIIDSTGNINIIIKKEEIKRIFEITPEKLNSLEDIKKFEEKIRFNLYYFCTKNKYDINGNLIIDNFNKVTQDEIKDYHLFEVKNYLNSLNNF